MTFQSSSGLKYPLDGLTLEQGVTIGTSNEATDETVEIRATDDAVFLVVTAVSDPHDLDIPGWF